MAAETILVEIGPGDTARYKALAREAGVETSWLVGAMIGYGYQQFRGSHRALHDAIAVARGNPAVAVETTGARALVPGATVRDDTGTVSHYGEVIQADADPAYCWVAFRTAVPSCPRVERAAVAELEVIG